MIFHARCIIIMGKNLYVNFFVIKFVTTLPKKKRFENMCALSILVKVRAEGKREIIRYTDFVKNTAISRWNVSLVFEIQNKTLQLTFFLVMKHIVHMK